MGMNDINSLSHTKWNCKDHIVFAPKYGRKVFYREKRAAVTGLVTASGRGIREQHCQAIMEYECKFFVYG